MHLGVVYCRKGRPQHLHQQRYDEIRKQYLSHGIGTFVARKIESAMDQGELQCFFSLPIATWLVLITLAFRPSGGWETF